MGHRYSIWLLIFSVMAFQVFVSIDAFSKDIQIDDVPKAIQKIIFREIGDVPIDDIDREKDDLDKRWEISKKRWDRLSSMIDVLNERDVQILIYLPPFHPIMRGEDVVDDDGTTLKGYWELVDRLQKLENQFPNLVFVDLNKGGKHDFSPEMFKDLDHMNALGATNMTQKLEEIRLRHAKKYRKRR